MSAEFFLKLSCPACDGHMEFPEYGVGQETNCPHCGEPLVLTDEKAWDVFKQKKGTLTKTQAMRVERARLAQMKSAGIKSVGILGCNCPADECDSYRRIKDEVFKIESVPPLPLPGCDNKYCKCIYIATQG
jgi:hypothetical protein